MLVSGASLEGYTTHCLRDRTALQQAPLPLALLLSPCHREWTFNDLAGAIQLSGKCAGR